MKSPEAGLKPSKRKLATIKPDKKLTANQWQSTPQQTDFMQRWTDPDSETFGNAYKSALAAKYSESYAQYIVSIGSQWIKEYQRLNKLELEHVQQKLISMINGSITRDQSNSPEDTRLKAIDLYSRVSGLLNTNNQVNVTVVQPILNGSSVKQAKVVDQ